VRGRHEHDVASVRGGEQRREARTTWTRDVDRGVDDRHRGVGAEPVDGAGQVAVEQRVTDDDEAHERTAGYGSYVALVEWSAPT
jgi:hypothetical protein